MNAPDLKQHPVPQSVLVVARSACVVEPELLNSERIEAKFGTYRIKLLSYRDGIRRASLNSLYKGREICRTYAVVRFDKVPERQVGEEHRRILAGASVGRTFRDFGWQIFKETRFVGEIRLPDQKLPLHALMAISGIQHLAMHVYRLYLKKESQIIEYSTIIEIHHPDYLHRDELAPLYLVDEPEALPPSELKALRALILQAP